MNLAAKLTEIRLAFENGDTPREIVKVLNSNIDNLLANKVADQALQPGENAPIDINIRLANSTFPIRELHKSDFLILNWFRGNW